MQEMIKWPAYLCATVLLGAVAGAVGCGGSSSDGLDDGSDGDPDFFCRENPRECEGDIGGGCADDADCLDGTCCEDKNCGGGMCTLRCDDDRDCPDSMLCEHSVCFFICDRDADCGEGQRCEHKSTICEYDGH